MAEQPPPLMSKLDLKKDANKLSDFQVKYMKLIEQQNLARAKKISKTRSYNVATGTVLGIGVLGVYMYSMLAVKQEKFLDELE